MHLHTDRFETVLPKTERFVSAKKPKLQWPSPWATLIAGAFIGMTILGAMLPKPQVSPAAVIPTPPPAPTPAPPLPEYRQPAIQPPAPTPVAEPPRALLVHLRPIGTYENCRMPDGRILGTTYRGELPSARNLPRTGGQLGDMWYTRQDGHTWVLAPVTGDSQSIGWVDP